MLSLRVGGSEKINMETLQISIVDLQNRYLIKNITYEYLKASNIINTTAAPPNQDYKIKISGLAFVLFNQYLS